MQLVQISKSTVRLSVHVAPITTVRESSDVLVGELNVWLGVVARPYVLS